MPILLRASYQPIMMNSLIILPEMVPKRIVCVLFYPLLDKNSKNDLQQY